jgi:hypothetical protein
MSKRHQRTFGKTMPLPPCALISSTRAQSGPLFVESILTGMHLQRVDMHSAAHDTAFPTASRVCRPRSIAVHAQHSFRTRRQGALHPESSAGAPAPAEQSPEPDSPDLGWALCA